MQQMVQRTIALICYRYKASGGAERYVDQLAAGLSARGWRVVLVTTEWHGESPFEIVPVHSWKLCSPLKILSFALNVRRVIRRHSSWLSFSLERTLEQDVVRAGGGSHQRWLEVRRSYLPWIKRCALRIDPLHWVLLTLERQSFSPKRTRLIIANSQMVKDDITRNYPFPYERIRVIYNGVDLSRFKPACAKPAKPFRIGFVGSGFERKGLAFAIETLALLPQWVELLIVGKGRLAPYLELAGRIGVAGRIRYAGYDIDTASFFGQVHLLLLPTLYDPFANVTLEALASGLPVVTTKMNGGSEIIEQGINGFVVSDPAQTEALAAGVRLFMRQDRWEAASAAARGTAERFPFERNVDETIEVLEQVWAMR